MSEPITHLDTYIITITLYISNDHNAFCHSYLNEMSRLDRETPETSMWPYDAPVAQSDFGVQLPWRIGMTWYNPLLHLMQVSEWRERSTRCPCGTGDHGDQVCMQRRNSSLRGR